MSTGSAIDTEYTRQELVVADSEGRVLQLYARGIHGDGMDDPTNGAFNGGYPSEESASYKNGTISANVTGTTTTTDTNKLKDSGANFGDWVVGCLVWNTTDTTRALCVEKVSTTELTLVDQGDGADIFPDVGDGYSIVTAAAIDIDYPNGAWYSYIVDTSAAWTPEYGKGTAYNYLSLRGLWCHTERSDGTILKKRIAADESNKLWFAGVWSASPLAGDTYYVAGIEFDFETGYVYPQEGHTLSLKEVKTRVVSTNGSAYWFELWGSNAAGNQRKESGAAKTKSTVEWLRDKPRILVRGRRHLWAQARFRGIVQDDQLVFRKIEFGFENHER